MTKHSKSFLLSLSIHLLIAATLLYGYTQVASLNKTPKEEEKRICIKLGKLTIPQKKETKSTLPLASTPAPTPPKQKKEAVVTKKPTPKKVLKKEKVVKKEKIVKKPPIKKPIKKKKEVVKKIEKVEEKVLPKEEVVTQTQETQEVILEKKPQLQENPQGNMTKKDCPEVCCDTRVSKEATYKNNNLLKIAQLLQENLYYPRRARKRGIEGKVLVRFTLLEDATVKDITVISSQNAILSRGAIKTIENLSGKFPKPQERLTLNVPIDYYLVK